MNSIRQISKFASILTVSLLTGAAAAPALADDAGYHAKQLKQTQAQTGSLLTLEDFLILGDAGTGTEQSGRSSNARSERERSVNEKGLTPSEKLWNRFERNTQFGQ